jgi:hypothetical protein
VDSAVDFGELDSLKRCICIMLGCCPLPKLQLTTNVVPVVCTQQPSLSIYCKFVNASWHVSHTRTGVIKRNARMGTLFCEHLSQYTPPQLRQWCRRKKVVKVAPTDLFGFDLQVVLMQILVSRSVIHLRATKAHTKRPPQWTDRTSFSTG